MVLKALVPLLSQVGDSTVRGYGPSAWGHFVIVDSLERIGEREALVIGRVSMEVPDGWELLTVSSVPGAVAPRDLHRILERVTSNLRENPHRAIVVACPEYLALHNGFEALLKFLNTVRDYAVVYGGRVYLVTERDAWGEREYALLKLLEM